MTATLDRSPSSLPGNGVPIDGWESVCKHFPFDWLQREIAQHAHHLEEVALDAGMPLRFKTWAGRVVGSRVLERKEIEKITDSARFREDGRAGIGGTLHRLSSIEQPGGLITGVRFRVGRFLPDVADTLLPYLERDPYAVICGRPGGGKTTVLRAIAAGLGRTYGHNLVIIEPSGEIGGSGVDLYPGMGFVTRFNCANPMRQEDTFIRAVRNASPEVLIGDEVGYAKDVEVICTRARSGCGVICTVHGNNLDDMMNNANLPVLLGDYDRITKVRHSSAPIHQLIEVVAKGVYRVYRSLNAAIDARAHGAEPDSDLVGAGVARFLEANPAWHGRCAVPEGIT